LLNENAFITFAHDRGLRVAGMRNGVSGDFYRRGWLTHDGVDADGNPHFHPFRIYPLHNMLKVCELPAAPAASLRRESVSGLVERGLASMFSLEQIGEKSQIWNRVVDLAILLEPLYWPDVTGHLSIGGGMAEQEFKMRLDQYTGRVLHLVKDLDPSFWREMHESLRLDAARLHENSRLYVLLRSANWEKRNELKGRISAALWIRHLAEVLRRGFEEAHGERWPEEVEEGNIVGLVAAHDPDFEFTNFAVLELAAVAAQIDELEDFSGGFVRNADWGGIRGMKAFEEKYMKTSARKCKLQDER
jgi:hypothetical protein